MEGIERLREVFEGAGLEAPPIPSKFHESIREFDEWLYATRAVNPMEMYFTTPYVQEVIFQPIDDYVAVSHAGHGINSYSINYQLVYGPLAIFAQTAWGGAYTDNDEKAVSLRDQFARCNQLIHAAERSVASRAVSPMGRLIVAESDFRTGYSRWGWLERPLGDAARVGEWLEEATTKEPASLLAALEWLETRPHDR